MVYDTRLLNFIWWLSRMDATDGSTWVPPRKTIDWRGNQVTEKEGIALKYLFDDLQNYFGQPHGEPNVIFNIKIKLILT